MYFKTANDKTIAVLNKSDWQAIGKKAGWLKVAGDEWMDEKTREFVTQLKGVMDSDSKVVKPIQVDERGMWTRLNFKYVVQAGKTANLKLTVLEFGFGGDREHPAESESLNAEIELPDATRIPCGYTQKRDPVELWNSIKHNLDQLFAMAQKTNIAQASPSVKTAHAETAESIQELDPNKILTDVNGKRFPIPPQVKNRVMTALHKLGDYFPSIPLDEMFNILKSNGLFPIQEDGTPWAGMIMGGAECGTPQADSQRVTFNLAFKRGDQMVLANCFLVMAWCVMSENPKKYEVIKYLS